MVKTPIRYSKICQKNSKSCYTAIVKFAMVPFYIVNFMVYPDYRIEKLDQDVMTINRIQIYAFVAASALSELYNKFFHTIRVGY